MTFLFCVPLHLPSPHPTALSSPLSLTTSTVYLGAISARHCRANGVSGAAATTTARNTFSLRIRSANVLMTLTPTLASSGKKTKIWSVGSSALGTRIVRSSFLGTSPWRSRNASSVVVRSSCDLKVCGAGGKGGRGGVRARRAVAGGGGTAAAPSEIRRSPLHPSPPTHPSLSLHTSATRYPLSSSIWKQVRLTLNSLVAASILTACVGTPRARSLCGGGASSS